MTARRPRGRAAAGVVLGARALGACLAGACAGAPTYMHGYGEAARREASLGWGLTAVSLVVSAVVAAIVLAACLRRRPSDEAMLRSRGGVRWIVVGGIVVPTVILAVAFVFTLGTLAATAAPARPPAFTAAVVGHEWWWEVRYRGDSTSDTFLDADELHVPVGRPVRLELSTADVIHSFWVPQLAGKTDLIPGQRNAAWIEADTPGVYWAHCAEFCGTQHANMALRVVAHPAAEFAAWRARARGDAVAPATADATAGYNAFMGSACTLCHAIRGTPAQGRNGPDLTHVGSRLRIAGGMLANTRGNLQGWIANPQALKPGSAMPTVELSSADLQAITTYLQSLK
ncbi:cytochrome c oxidase subunit II [Gemmatimonadetes bacterium T265]|nr:cytochrome c oxidase subunit II [Gemmatimonadetes bacterium T265]